MSPVREKERWSATDILPVLLRSSSDIQPVFFFFFASASFTNVSKYRSVPACLHTRKNSFCASVRVRLRMRARVRGKTSGCALADALPHLPPSLLSLRVLLICPSICILSAGL